MRVLTYAVTNDGFVYSRLVVNGHTNGFAVPVLDFEGMDPQNGFEPTYDLNKFDNLSGTDWRNLTWTKKVPINWKNIHRLFWGMKPLPMTDKRQFTYARQKVRLPGDPGYKKVK